MSRLTVPRRPPRCRLERPYVGHHEPPEAVGRGRASADRCTFARGLRRSAASAAPRTPRRRRRAPRARPLRLRRRPRRCAPSGARRPRRRRGAAGRRSWTLAKPRRRRRPRGARPRARDRRLCVNQPVSRVRQGHAIEPASRRWRGGHDLCTGRQFVSTQGATSKLASACAWICSASVRPVGSGATRVTSHFPVEP